MREDGLTTNQAKALAALVEGKTYTQAAAEAGVSRRTLWNWRKRLPAFETALAEVRCATTEEIRARALRIADSLLTSIEEAARDMSTPAAVKAQLLNSLIKVASLDRPPDPDDKPAPDLKSWREGKGGAPL